MFCYQTKPVIYITRHIKQVACIITISGLSGCGPMVPVVKMDNLTPQEKHDVAQMAIYDGSQLLNMKYKILNIVEGISCKNKVWDHAATKSDAINQAKYWAKQAGADGVANVQCDNPRGTTTSYNCWESITCTAEAIKLQ
jgi:uncharacterized protein YbjQ (UPF0145 family)